MFNGRTPCFFYKLSCDVFGRRLGAFAPHMMVSTKFVLVYNVSPSLFMQGACRLV
jgi:hypothetical protein